MRIAIDYTPAISQGAGVGRYTRSLVRALVARAAGGESFTLWYAAGDDVARDAALQASSPTVSLRRIPVPERVLTLGWQRLHVPLRVERLIGPADVIHAPDFVAPPSRAPVVATIHDLSYLITPDKAHPNLRNYLMDAVPRTLERAARVIAVSRTTATDLEERYKLPPERIAVIPNGVDPLFQPPDAQTVQRVLAQLEVQRPYYVVVGTVEPRKNHLTLLQAFQQVYTAHPDASLVIVGKSGWLSDPIEAEIHRLARWTSIRRLRMIEDWQLPALLAGSLALVYPSWYEGFGLPVVEAMASGTAVITSNVGALAEVAGEAALLVPPGDPEALSAAMRRLYDDADLRADLIRRGLARAACYTWDAAAALHLRLYHEVGGA